MELFLVEVTSDSHTLMSCDTPNMALSPNPIHAIALEDFLIVVSVHYGRSELSTFSLEEFCVEEQKCRVNIFSDIVFKEERRICCVKYVSKSAVVSRNLSTKLHRNFTIRKQNIILETYYLFQIFFS
jgi:hypothetical protein